MGKEWIDTACPVERVNFAAKPLGDVSKPGVRRIIEHLRAQGELSPEGLVDSCLDLPPPHGERQNARGAAQIHQPWWSAALRRREGQRRAPGSRVAVADRC